MWGDSLAVRGDFVRGLLAVRMEGPTLTRAVHETLVYLPPPRFRISGIPPSVGTYTSDPSGISASCWM